MGRWNGSRATRVRAPETAPGEMPVLIEPQLATLIDRHPPEGEWSYEIKFDGYRMLTRIESGEVKLITRNGHDWTERMPRLRAALTDLPADSAWIDGEAVVLDASGKPDFNSLQNAFDRRSTADIVLYVFDLLWLNGTDVREQPLRSRRALLHELMQSVESPLLRYSDDFAEDPVSLVASACKMKLEGIIGKRADAPYRSGRSNDWIKLLRAFFVVDRPRRPSNQGLRRLCAIAMSLISFVRTRYLHFLCVETDVGGVLCHRIDGQALPA
ncbi:DNA polymerase [Caballeronia temeraria]|uniref:DNA polymerase n=1 Tax=Caballeronia temeraria TaxID=1777137 RepID=A0A158C091_9BURK|nr:hypothetical protein [Caballeronia temeraria]SAK75681.1 DNA polymerase [Caballeronia temeraria]